MPTPDFVLALRASIGHALLPMSGVTGVVLNDRGQVLLGRRVDNGDWSLPSGILEPGEQPAQALVREIAEETGVVARIEAMTSVFMQAPITYANGDQAQYLDLCFLGHQVSGEAHVADDESLEVGWFEVTDLPDGLAPSPRAKLARALAFEGTTWFEPATPPCGDGRVARSDGHTACQQV